MCTVNHDQAPNAGYLIDVPMESMTGPGFFFPECYHTIMKSD